MKFESIKLGIQIANSIRMECDLNVVTETLRRSMRSQMREANRLNAKYVIILGEDELKAKTVVVKNMMTGKQNHISMEKIINYFIQ